MKKIIWFIFFLYLVAFPFGQLNLVPLSLFSFQEVHLYITDILVGVIGVLGLIWQISKKQKQITPYTKQMAIFLVATFFSLLLAISSFKTKELFIAFLYLLRIAAYGTFYMALLNIVEFKKEKQLLFSSLITVGVTMSIFGWIGYFVFPDIRPLTQWGWDEHLNRIVGTFLDPSFTSIILVFTLILLTGNLTKNWHFGKVLIWIFVFSTLLFTYSRSGFIAFLAGIATFSFLSKKPSILVYSSLLLFFGIVTLPRPEGEGVRLERTATVISRLQNWQETLELIKEKPLFGFGFNTLRYVRNSPSRSAAGADNSFLFIASTTGIIGFIAFLSLLFSIFSDSARLHEGKFIFATLVAACTHALFVNSLFYPWVLGWMLILLVVFSKTKAKTG